MNNVQNLNCIVLIDESVKSKMKINISNLTVYGIDIVTNIREITQDNLKRSRKVIILGTYRFDGLDDLKLYKDMLNLEYYMISDDKLSLSIMSKYCKCFYLDYTILTNTMIASVLYNDVGEQQKYQPSINKLSTVDKIEELMNVTSDEFILDMCKDYIRLRGMLEDSLLQENEYVERISNLESKIINNVNEINLISENFKDLVGKVIEQNKVLKDYQVILSRDIYDKLYTSSYRNRPIVLYLKEYEPMIHENSFLTTLMNCIRIQGNKACKFVRLHDSNDLFRIKTLESNYKVIGNSFLESEVVNEDMILSYGNYKKLLGMLLDNRYKLDVLVVLDCKKYPDVVISGSDVVYLNVCRNRDSMKVLDLKEDNTITNNSGLSLSWDTYLDYDRLENKTDKFQYLSSRSVIKRIYRLIKQQ